MGAQHLIVFCVVLGSGLYAAWVLMPSAVRRWLATGLLRLPLVPSLRAALQRAAAPASGCDCSGCDTAVDKRDTAGTRRVIRLHVRPKN